MRHWLVKSEPTVYSFARLREEGGTRWDGIRNAQARIWLGEMKRGDRVLFYHSQTDKAVVGEAEVAKEAYPDPTADDGKWLCVDLAPVRALPTPVTLGQFRDEPLLAGTYLVKQGRLSVVPLSPEQYARVIQLGGL
ncbi:MAG: EVE domain-containing protein [Myxococcota bacterium]